MILSILLAIIAMVTKKMVTMKMVAKKMMTSVVDELFKVGDAWKPSWTLLFHR